MNLADAIRQAATSTGIPLPAETQAAEITVVENPNWAPEAEQQPAGPSVEARVPDQPSPAIAGGSVVRLELFLSPEQLTGLFRAIVGVQHTVMTLREAATYLRVPAGSLEQMAQEGQVPAFLIDGKWRFQRSGLDEWLSMRSHQKEAEA
jgi:excisionase family DNA binding protein